MNRATTAWSVDRIRLCRLRLDSPSRSKTNAPIRAAPDSLRSFARSRSLALCGTTPVPCRPERRERLHVPQEIYRRLTSTTQQRPFRPSRLHATSLEGLPAGSTARLSWLDLDGEGLSGALTKQAGARLQTQYQPLPGDSRRSAFRRSRRFPPAPPAFQPLFSIAGGRRTARPGDLNGPVRASTSARETTTGIRSAVRAWPTSTGTNRTCGWST